MKKISNILILLVILCCFSGCAKMNLKSETFTIELGENPKDMKEKFVELKDADISDVVFDFSKVDCDKVGKYIATATFNGKSQEFTIVVKDTVAPKMKYNKNVTLQVGEKLSLGDVIKSIDEKSGQVNVYVEGHDVDSDAEKIKIGEIVFPDTELIYDQAGEYTEKVILEDNAGNEKKYKLYVTVENKQETEQEEIAKPQENVESVEENAGDWVSGLGVAQQTNQLIVVAAQGSTATVSMHTKDGQGVWQENLSTSGYVGAQGVGQASEYSSCSPRGVWSLGIAFGNNPNPGTAVGYTQVDDTYYWVDDVNSAYYNRFVSTRDVAPDWNSAEHIQSCGSAYNYVISINYNTDCVPGNGSAFFLHCSTGSPTMGCVSVPESVMVQIMQLYQPGCLILIDQADAVNNY